MRNEFNVAENVIVAFDKVHDSFGFLRDTCEVIVTEKNRHKTIYPVHPPLKVTTQSKSEPLMTHSELKFGMTDALEVYEEWRVKTDKQEV